MKTLSRIYNALIFLFLYSPIVVLIVFICRRASKKKRERRMKQMAENQNPQG